MLNPRLAIQSLQQGTPVIMYPRTWLAFEPYAKKYFGLQLVAKVDGNKLIINNVNK